MAKDAVTALETTRQKLIQQLLSRKRKIDEQLKGLGYDDKKAASN